MRPRLPPYDPSLVLRLVSRQRSTALRRSLMLLGLIVTAWLPAKSVIVALITRHYPH